MSLIELDIGVEWGNKNEWYALCKASASASIRTSPFASLLQNEDEIEISIKLSDSDEVQELNKMYRNKDKPTNVLSFPSLEKELLHFLPSGDEFEILLGDIILAKSVCEQESEEKQISFSDHVSHLVVHGTLHLLGYDHQNDADAEIMENLEIEALQTLGISNPYTELH